LEERSISLRAWIEVDALQKLVQLCLVFLPHVVRSRGVLLSRRQFKTLRMFMLWNDVFAILWLVQGSTLFSSTGSDACRDTHAPHVFNLGLGLLVMSMISMSLPLIVCAAMVPLICFCLPCFIRVVLAARTSRVKGASRERLSALPSVRYEPGALPAPPDSGSPPPACAICLSGYVEGEELRVLKCDNRHHFHKACIDDWLLINASCPVCRKSVFDGDPATGDALGTRDVEQGLLHD
jgi:hypothetical protein